MQVFIVRPFGTKKVLKLDKATGQSTTVAFNFDAVEAELIAPAITAVNLTGGTTGKIFEAGDIREDMFSLLLLADVVIADISIHNANAFYELGIRHAFRDQFLNESVQFAGPDWVDRFDAIYHTTNSTSSVEILAESEELPDWLKKKPDYSFWERNSLWLLHKALANGGQYMTLIAMGDGQPGDSGGGTRHMINQAQGVKTVVINERV